MVTLDNHCATCSALLEAIDWVRVLLLLLLLLQGVVPSARLCCYALHPTSLSLSSSLLQLKGLRLTTAFTTPPTRILSVYRPNRTRAALCRASLCSACCCWPRNRRRAGGPFTMNDTCRPCHQPITVAVSVAAALPDCLQRVQCHSPSAAFACGRVAAQHTSDRSCCCCHANHPRAHHPLLFPPDV